MSFGSRLLAGNLPRADHLDVMRIQKTGTDAWHAGNVHLSQCRTDVLS